MAGAGAASSRDGLSALSDLSRALPSVALRPWQQRPDEPLQDWLAFVAWLLSVPRPPVLPEGAHDAARQWQWTTRAAMAESFLAERDDPRIMARDVALNALEILNRELAYRCGESRRQPGGVPIPELFKLLQMWADMGGPSVTRPDDAGETWCDMSQLTPAEQVTFTELSAKCWRRRE